MILSNSSARSRGSAVLHNITLSVILMNVMTGTSLQQHRRGAGWTQARLADRLGVTQAYLSLMERGRRRVPDRLAQAATRLLRLPATTLPLPAYAAFDTAVAESWVEQSLSRLGYPGFAHRRHPGVTRNPVEVLLRALAFDDLDPRLAEALPWLLLRFEDLVFRDPRNPGKDQGSPEPPRLHCCAGSTGLGEESRVPTPGQGAPSP